MRLRPPPTLPLAALTLLLASTGLSGASLATPAGRPITVRLVAINDFHGNLEADDLELRWPNPANPAAPHKLAVGGAAALAGLIHSLRQDRPYSLVLSSGDLFGATPLISALLRHEPTLATAHRLGVALATPGNHEFDAGQKELLRLLQGRCGAPDPRGATQSCAFGPIEPARFQTLAANLAAVDGPPPFAPYAIRAFGGVKVGFIGAVTRATPLLVTPSAIEGLRFGEEAQGINQAAAALQRQGVQAIVVLIHEGGETGDPSQPLDWNNSRCPAARGRIFAIAQQLSPAVDVVFSAHTHQGYNCRQNGRPILQATSYGRGVAVVDVALNPRSGDVDRARTVSRNLPVLNERTAPALRQAVLAGEPAPWRAVLARSRPDAAVAADVTRWASAVAPIAQRVVGQITGSFERGGPADSTAGRLIADAQLAATRAAASGGAEAALTNPGGIRASLPCEGHPPCSVRYGQLFAMQPFGNTLTLLTLSGAELKELLESQQPPGREPATLLSPSATLRYRWQARAPHGQRVSDLRLHDRPIQPDQEVRLVVNSFLAAGGDGFTAFRKGRHPRGGPLELEALEMYLRRARSPDPNPRITLVP
jgi:5'-nucleotidase